MKTTNNSSRQQLEKEIFFEADEIEGEEERDSFLRERCGGDESLLIRLQTLFKKSEDDLLGAGGYEEMEALDEAMGQLLEERKNLDVLSAVSKIGDYTLIEEIGRGSMGIVFRARQNSLNRDVALKVILGSNLASELERERFRIEAEAAAHLDHPNIVPVYETGRDDGHDFYSMLLVSGGTLTERMPAFVDDRRKAVQLIVKILDAVRAAHERGIIHRDLKPDNILLNEDGKPMVSDFGLASRMEKSQGLTLTGQIMGTPAYMAPEQAEGGGVVVTTAADIHSIGAILYEMLSGVSAFKSDSLLKMLVLVKERVPKRLGSMRPGIDPDLETIVAKCLEKDPADRYRSAGRLRDDLIAWLEGRPISARSPNMLERVYKWGRRRPIHAALVGVSVLMVGSLGIGGPLLALKQASLKDEATQAREDVEERAAANQRLLYAANMLRVGDAVSDSRSFPGLNSLLQSWLPDPENPIEDLRGWEWYFLSSYHHQAEHEIVVGSHDIAACRLDPGGKWVAVASDAVPEIPIYEVESGKKIFTLSEHEDDVLDVDWDPTGKRLVSASRDGDVIVWDVLEQKILQRWSSGAGYIQSVRWHPDGKSLAMFGKDCLLRLWQLKDEAPGTELKTSFRAAIDDTLKPPMLSWSPSGDFIAVTGEAGYGNHPVLVFDARSGNVDPISLKADMMYPFALSWHPEGEKLAVAGRDRVIYVWEPQNGKKHEKFSSNDSSINAVAWDRKGEKIITGSNSRELRVWDMARKEVVRSIPGHDQPITSLDWNSRWIVTGDAQGMLRVFKTGSNANPKTLFRFEKPIGAVRWHPDGNSLAVMGYDLKLYNLEKSGKPGWVVKRHWSAHSNFGWNDAADTFSTVTDPDVVQFFDEATGEDTHLVRVPKDWGSILGTTMTPKGDRMFVFTPQPPRISEWDTSNGELLNSREWEPGSQVLAFLEMSPDGRFLLAAGRYRVHLISRETGEAKEWKSETIVNACVWHPDGEHFATAHVDGSILLWSRDRDQPIGELLGHASDVYELAWHPDGRRLASSSGDKTARIWDTENQQLVLTLAGHDGEVRSVAWSPDGKVLATTSLDGTIRLWDGSSAYGADERENDE